MELFDRKGKIQAAERVLIVQLKLPDRFQYYDQNEAIELTQSAGGEVIEIITFSVDSPKANILIGKGQAEFLKEQINEHEADLVYFNYPLSPSQDRNIVKLLDCRVIDRAGIILDIFALRARTHEGRLQVELAQMNHMSTRLIRGWTHLERQKGGIGMRGPGETQLESDRRMIALRIKQLKSQLEKVRSRRQLGRSRRERQQVPCIALVGYTNAGKSTLFNTLCKTKIYATDQLFATLDTTIRQIHIQGMGTCLIIDTVGFIQHLPPDLIAAFRSTLEESVSADLLLHVIDASDEASSEKINSVQQTLEDIEVRHIPTLSVMNKTDLMPTNIIHEAHIDDTVFVSAVTELNLATLKTKIAEKLKGKYRVITIELNPSAGALRSKIFELGEVLNEHYEEDGIMKIELRLIEEAYQSLKKNTELKIISDSKSDKNP